MNRLKKTRILSILLCVFLLIGIAPSVLAAENLTVQAGITEVRVPLNLNTTGGAFAGAQFTIEITGEVEFVSYDRSGTAVASATNVKTTKDGKTYIGFVSGSNAFVPTSNSLTLGTLIFTYLADTPATITVSEFKLERLSADKNSTQSETFTNADKTGPFVITYNLTRAADAAPNPGPGVVDGNNGAGGGGAVTAPTVEIGDGETPLTDIGDIETPLADAMPFTDVVLGDWFYGAVKYVYDIELMNGESDTLFAPDSNLTRAMLVTILYRLEGSPAVTSSSSFTDVPDGQWYSDAIAWAEANEIVGGYGNGLFGTNDNITREQFALILFNYAAKKGYDTSTAADLSKYTDADKISLWALDAMKWANIEGLINGRTETTLAPGGTATRAEAATILMRFVEDITK